MGEIKTKLTIKHFMSLPKAGLNTFVDFTKRAAIETNDLIKDLLTKNQKSESEVKETAEYVIAKQYYEMYEKRYGKKFIREFIAYFDSPKVQELINDQVSLETMKVLVSDEDREIIKRRDRANGIMIVPKLAENLEVYRMVVARYETEHPEVVDMLEKTMDEGEERIGEEEVEGM